MASDVPLQLAQLDTCVIALWTLVRLLVRVAVPNVTDQLSGGGERRIAELAQVRLGSGVRVDVIGEAGDGFESALADVALVGPKKELK